mgnify:CR=1 FL=1|jgi:hypothetical protein
MAKKKAPKKINQVDTAPLAPVEATPQENAQEAQDLLGTAVTSWARDHEVRVIDSATYDRIVELLSSLV